MKKDTFGLVIATVFAVCFSIILFSIALKYLQQKIEQKSISTICKKDIPESEGLFSVRKEQVTTKIALPVPGVVPLPEVLPQKIGKTPETSTSSAVSISLPKVLPLPLSCVQPSTMLPEGIPATASRTIARIAIILDDVGYSTGGFVSKLWQIKVPLTMSVIPGLICSREAAEVSHRCGFEVMLHMPMEYCNNSRITGEDLLCMADRKNNSPYKWALLSGMSEKEVQRQLEGAIKDLPYIKGINNHMGSKATADSKLMTLCMDKLKGKGLYFVDSVTTSKTVAYRLAKEYGLEVARRNVFLDNVNSIEHVRQQMHILIATAKKNGTAIGIGHATKASTAAVLSEMVPALKAQGIEVVPASKLVH